MGKHYCVDLMLFLKEFMNADDDNNDNFISSNSINKLLIMMW